MWVGLRNWNFIFNFAAIIEQVGSPYRRLKGNRVKIPDRPAAVSSVICHQYATEPGKRARREGDGGWNKSEDLPILCNPHDNALEVSVADNKSGNERKLLYKGLYISCVHAVDDGHAVKHLLFGR